MSYSVEKSFDFWVPISKATSSVNKAGKRIIEGIASTADRDLQGEVVYQDGIVYDYFQKYGYFNWDHKKGAENKIGEPTVVKKTSKGLYVKGFLYNNKKVADEVWEHITALASNPDSRRKMGFSLQGKTIRKQGSNVLTSWIQDIAITTAPVNYNTYLDIVKSLSAGHPVGASSGGGVLIPEDLSGRGGSAEDDDIINLLSKKDKRVTEKSLTKFISTQLGWDSKAASQLTKILFNLASRG